MDVSIEKQGMLHIFHWEMIEITNFHELPDSIRYEDMKKYFIEYLKYYSNNTNQANILYALSELLELADRQWHTYKILDGDIKSQLEKYLKAIINFEDAEIMDYALSIIPLIGMSSLFNYIEIHKCGIKNKNILSIITEAELEYKGNVENPYTGMK